MILAAHLPRDKSTGRPTVEAQALATRVARYGRVLAVFFSATVNNDYAVLCTRAGLQRLQARGALTENEVEYLSNISPGQWCYVLMTWNMTIIQEGLQPADGEQEGHQGCLAGVPDSFHRVVIEKLLELRAACGTIEDEIAGRMPLAYPRFVQVCVDTLCVNIVPAMVYEFNNYAAPFVAAYMILVFMGVIELSKALLDPCSNDPDSPPKKRNVAYFGGGVLLSEVYYSSKSWLEAIARPLPWRRKR
eukprot:TRINITY_DN4582_c0_g1_i1.p1 TRINITY_DN4582_c0_g1~~TRINITY_DN4582_c0_g1_i1.p1  ORF type:complete len:247 (-),score=22.89 TRINITY_DN4582_c0_g1_i1:238-978(-)